MKPATIAIEQDMNRAAVFPTMPRATAPLAIAPALSLGVGMLKAAAAFAGALRHAYGQAGANLRRGLFIDIERIGHTPEEREFIDQLEREGALGKTRKVMQHGLDSVVDQANRAATALAFYRLARDPETLQRMATAWSSNQVFHDMVERDGLTSETMGRFGLTEAVLEWGKANQSQIMREPLGTLAVTLHGLQTRLLTAALKFAKSAGRHGARARGGRAAGKMPAGGLVPPLRRFGGLVPACPAIRFSQCGPPHARARGIALH